MSQGESYIGIFVKPNSTTGFVYQNSKVTLEADSYQEKDSNGNTCKVVWRDHRVRVSLTADFPAGGGVPVQGSTIALAGVVLPTVSAAGVVSGSFSVGVSGGTTTTFTVDGSPSVGETNSGFTSVDFELVKYLPNGL